MTPPRIGVGWFFSASHTDPIRQQLHGHSYEVICWFELDAPRDAVILQERLKAIVGAFDHTTLPPELSRAEDMAAAIMRLMDCDGVTIGRPLERLYASVGRCG